MMMLTLERPGGAMYGRTTLSLLAGAWALAGEVRVSVSHQPVDACRAIADRCPESIALFRVTACAGAADEVIAGGRLIQHAEGLGVSVMDSDLVGAVVSAARDRPLVRVARLAEQLLPLAAAVAVAFEGAPVAARVVPAVTAVGVRLARGHQDRAARPVGLGGATIRR